MPTLRMVNGEEVGRWSWKGDCKYYPRRWFCTDGTTECSCDEQITSGENCHAYLIASSCLEVEVPIVGPRSDQARVVGRRGRIVPEPGRPCDLAAQVPSAVGLTKPM